MVEVLEQLFCSIEGCNEKYYANGLCKKHCKEQYYQDHKKKLVEYTNQYYKEHKEDKRQYYIDNKEEIIKKRKRYAKTSTGRAIIKANGHNRRALLKGLTAETVQRVYEDNIKQFGTLTCILCGKLVEFADSSLEHLTPLSRGGTNNYDNLGVAHKHCNYKKHAMTLDEWFEKQEGDNDLR